MSGGQDGVLRIWDARAQSSAYRVECHASERGTGAISCVEPAGQLLATAGADRRVCVLEPRSSFRVLYTFEDHSDFIYSLRAAGEVLLSGSGAGMLLCHSLVEGRLLYGMGANQGAVRAIETSGQHLVAAGDDGKCLIYGYL